MTRLLLIDGHSLLFQMYYGMPARIVNKDGQAIGGVIGFIGVLFKIIKMSEPTHVLIVFDGEHSNINNKIIDGYKANRKDYTNANDDDNPFLQLPIIYKVLDYLEIKHYEEIEFEADDAIAGYINTYKDIEIIISSLDTDFIQLIRNNVKLLKYRGKSTTIIDENEILKKYHISPNSYVDFKALVGDKADNIKGVKGIGPITAAKLINEYETLNNILANLDKIENSKIKNSLNDKKDLLLKNYQAIKLNKPVNLRYLLDDLEYKLNGTLTTKKILETLNIL